LKEGIGVIGRRIQRWIDNLKVRERIKRRVRLAKRFSSSHSKPTSRTKLTMITAILVMQAVTAMPTNTGKHVNMTNFDTDLETIGIDNRCTACISHKIEDFIGPLRES
jgi:hypothetical protein